MADQTLLSGAYASLEGLLRCRFLARELNLARQRKILAQQSGGHSSRFRGRGVDFTEVRLYQPGDDIRAIDWRVTARTQRPHTKLYTEERERPAMILTDQRTSLFFGSRVAFKSVIAAYISALLAWSALARGDRIGGLVFSDYKHQVVPAKRNQHAVLRLMESLLNFNQSLGKNESPKEKDAANPYSLADQLTYFRRTLKPGSELFVISDFADFDGNCKQHLYQLSRHNDLVCIRVYDHLEAEAPRPGRYQVSDGAQTTEVNFADKDTRARYQSDFQQRTAYLEKQMSELKIPLLSIRTDDDLVQALRSGLGLYRKPRK